MSISLTVCAKKDEGVETITSSDEPSLRATIEELLMSTTNAATICDHFLTSRPDEVMRAAEELRAGAKKVRKALEKENTNVQKT